MMLSIGHKKALLVYKKGNFSLILVNSEGFEPPISWAVTRCIIQLCYESLGERKSNNYHRKFSFLTRDSIFAQLLILRSFNKQSYIIKPRGCFFAHLFEKKRMKYLVAAVLLVSSLLSFGQEKLNQPDLPGEVMVDIGLNYLDDEPLTIDQAGWSSKSIAFYYTRRKQFGRKLAVNYGLGLGLEKLSLGDSTSLFSQYFNGSDFEAVSIQPLPNQDPTDDPFFSYDKNKLAITYLEVPLDIRFYPKGTVAGEGLFVGVGGMAGIRLNSKIKLKYDYAGETVIDKTSGEFNLNSFRYGLQARLGFRGVHLFYKQYMSDLFQDELGGANPRMTTIGINVSGF